MIASLSHSEVTFIHQLLELRKKIKLFYKLIIKAEVGRVLEQIIT